MMFCLRQGHKKVETRNDINKILKIPNQSNTPKKTNSTSVEQSILNKIGK